MIGRLVCFIGLLAFTANLDAQELRVALFSGKQLKQILLNPGDGVAVLKVDTAEIAVVQKGVPLYCSLESGAIQVKLGNENLGYFAQIKLQAISDNTYIKVLAQQPGLREQWYQGHLELRAMGENIQLINVIDLESYISGVVEAETGSEQNKEFYKVQSCITRTFALANVKKHFAEGYNLCDQVHCQVYKGKAHSNPAIPQAVAETAGLVMVDKNLQLIDAVFHANCGGQTHNSEDYWVDTVSYLRSVIDPHCSEGNQFNWKISLSKEPWLRYLYGNFNFPIDQSEWLEKACQKPLENRQKYFLSPELRIPLRRIRSDWNLRSTRFSIREEDERIILEGKGFGHGVGLCQEGAMKMAKEGNSFTDILHFYFTEVFVIPKNQLFILQAYR